MAKSHKTTRRRFLAGIGATGVGAALTPRSSVTRAAVILNRHSPLERPRPLLVAPSAAFWCVATLALVLTVDSVRGADYAIGADVSFLKQAEDAGAVFRDGPNGRPGLQILKDHGYGWVRLRLFHSPTNLPNNLEYTLALAKQARERGFKLLLNYHYSDTWADPGRQLIPAAWRGKSHPALVAAVRNYTHDTQVAFREAGLRPDMVQLGNEITSGMLWPDGKLPDHWDNFVDLIKGGIQGVETGRGTNAPPRIMIHIACGGDKQRTKGFFDKLHSYGVAYDVMGQSYYPWWHGSLLDLRENLHFMATTYARDILLVEVAYCWRPAEYRNKPAPFPESPEGQREFLEEVNRLLLNTPNHRGAGIFWWEPAVARGRLRDRGFFDDDNQALPVIQVFDRWSRK
jgi:arabinogalactan endo-1,4-beta-galactosidase